MHGATQIVRDEGIGGIYRGLLPVVRFAPHCLPPPPAPRASPNTVARVHIGYETRSQLGSPFLGLLDPQAIRARIN